MPHSIVPAIGAQTGDTAERKCRGSTHISLTSWHAKWCGTIEGMRIISTHLKADDAMLAALVGSELLRRPSAEDVCGRASHVRL